MTSLATLLSLAGEARGGRLHQADAGRCHVSGFGCHADDRRGQDNARQPLARRLWSRPGCKVRSHALSFLKSGGRAFFFFWCVALACAYAFLSSRALVLWVCGYALLISISTSRTAVLCLLQIPRVCQHGVEIVAHCAEGCTRRQDERLQDDVRHSARASRAKALNFLPLATICPLRTADCSNLCPLCCAGTAFPACFAVLRPLSLSILPFFCFFLALNAPPPPPTPHCPPPPPPPQSRGPKVTTTDPSVAIATAELCHTRTQVDVV
jgi:hypothetical protein